MRETMPQCSQTAADEVLQLWWDALCPDQDADFVNCLLLSVLNWRIGDNARRTRTNPQFVWKVMGNKVPNMSTEAIDNILAKMVHDLSDGNS